MAYPIDPVLAAGLTARGRQRICRADVLSNGVPVITGLRISGGSVNVSGSQSPRRSATCTAVDVDGDLVVDQANDVLAPYGNEVALYRGLRIAGVDWPVPVGVFRIDRADSTWAGGSTTVALKLTDRSATVSAAKFTNYVSIAAGTPVTTAILTLVAGTLSVAQAYSFTPITQTVSLQTYAPGDDRWDAATKLAEQVGCLLYFDPAGVLTLAPVPDPRTTPAAWQFGLGEVGLLTSAANSLDRAAAINTVVAMNSGSSVDTPNYAIAEDADPSSPTYVYGPFGRQVATVTTNLPLSSTALQTYATSQLMLSLGATQQATLSALCLPQLDAFDVIGAVVPQVGLASQYVIDQLSIPLGGGVMSITTRGIVV